MGRFHGLTEALPLTHNSGVGWKSIKLSPSPLKLVIFVVGDVLIGLFLWWADRSYPDLPSWMLLATAVFLAGGILPLLVWPSWREIVVRTVKSTRATPIHADGNIHGWVALLGIWHTHVYDPLGEERRIRFWPLWTRPLFDHEKLYQRVIVQECEYQARDIGKIDSRWSSNPERATDRFRWCLQVSGLDWERCVEGEENCAAFGHEESEHYSSMFLDDPDPRRRPPSWNLPKPYRKPPGK